MKSTGCKNRTRIAQVALGLSWVVTTAAMAQQAVVAEYASFNPSPNGSPYGQLQSAMCDAQDILMFGGTYPEALYLDEPLTISGTNGVARIGDFARLESTTIRVLTYNTHLFGNTDIIPGLEVPDIPGCEDIPGCPGLSETINFIPDWADETRAIEIGKKLKDYNVDVVLLQEVWHQTMANHIINHAGVNANGTVGVDFVASYYADDVESPGTLNSGLLVLSRYPFLSGPTQVIYADEPDPSACLEEVALFTPNLTACLLEIIPDEIGACMEDTAENVASTCDMAIEAFATKGFTRLRIQKDGFPFLIWNTHAQAHYSSAEVAIRAAQLAQLGNDIAAQKAIWVGDALIAGGDFNVYGDEVNPFDGGAEYAGSLKLAIGDVGEVFDAERNAPCWTYDEFIWTVSASNSLNTYFDPNPPPGAANGRLDYLFANGSFDGSIRLLHRQTQVIKFMAPFLMGGSGSEGYHEDTNLSDHYALRATFEVFRSTN